MEVYKLASGQSSSVLPTRPTTA